MREPTHLATLDRENGTQVRVAVEETDDGRKAVTLRIWKRDHSGGHRPTKFGASVRRSEIPDLIRALDLAGDLMDRRPDPPARLEPRARINRFLDDARQIAGARNP